MIWKLNGYPFSTKALQRCEKAPANGSNFDLSNKLYLTTQQCDGGGLTKAKVFAGVLGMHTNALRGRLERNIGASRVKDNRNRRGMHLSECIHRDGVESS
jgi:hypothetical protein